jgi:hypothetical protein
VAQPPALALECCERSPHLSGRSIRSRFINRRDTDTVLTRYGAWLYEQPLSSRIREVYLAAVNVFVA